MDPIYPWLDPNEVRRLAERLMRPDRAPSVTVTDAGFDETFIGFASEEPATQVGATLPPVPEPPPEAIPAEELPPAPTAAQGPFLDRVNHFRDWLSEAFSAAEIFILDRDGVVIFDESGHGRLHFVARSVALASRRLGAPAGNVHLKISAGATLEVIPVANAYGCFVLGAVVPEALSPASVAAVMEALARVATPPTEGAVTSSGDSGV